MKLTEFTENNQLNEYFLRLNYDMWGWVNPSGVVVLPSRKDANDPNREVHHSILIKKWGLSEGYRDAFSRGWIRWYLSGGRLVFNCYAMPNTVNALAKAVRTIESYAKNPKKFNYFNGDRAERESRIPGGMLLINYYIIEIDRPRYKFFDGSNFSRPLNELKAFMDEQGIDYVSKPKRSPKLPSQEPAAPEGDLTEMTSAGATGAGSVAVSPTGFASGGIGTPPIRRGSGVSATGIKQKRKRSVNETHMPGHLDHEVRMAHGELLNLAQNSAELYDMLNSHGEREGLPGWISAYVTLSNDYIESVIQYMREEQIEQRTQMDHDF